MKGLTRDPEGRDKVAESNEQDGQSAHKHRFGHEEPRLARPSIPPPATSASHGIWDPALDGQKTDSAQYEEAKTQADHCCLVPEPVQQTRDHKGEDGPADTRAGKHDAGCQTAADVEPFKQEGRTWQVGHLRTSESVTVHGAGRFGRTSEGRVKDTNGDEQMPWLRSRSVRPSASKHMPHRCTHLASKSSSDDRHGPDEKADALQPCSPLSVCRKHPIWVSSCALRMDVRGFTVRIEQRPCRASLFARWMPE